MHRFGNSYPLLAPPAADPAPSAANPAKAEKATPILGHVSMLNAILFLPASMTFAHPDFVISGDRDEHVRVSRYPRGEVIEKFLWGSKRCVRLRAIFLSSIDSGLEGVGVRMGVAS